MKIKRPFAPGFINKLDENLLLNKPDTWSARTHLVIYYGVLFAVILFIIGFLVPNDPRNNSSIYTWVSVVGIVSFIAFIVWLIYLLRFNVFKRFGIVTPGDRIKTFFLYFLSIGTMVSWPFIPTIVESIRANKAYGNEELVTDVNNINIKLLQIERDSIPLKWTSETFIVKDSLPYRKYTVEENAIEEVEALADTLAADVSNSFERNRNLIDTAELRMKISEADSLIKINDSTYTFYKCPEYQFVHPYYADEYTSIKLFTSVALYERILKNYRLPDKQIVGKELKSLLDKYKRPDDINYNYSNFTSEEDSDKALKKYALNRVTNNITNIAEKKYSWRKDNWPKHIRVFFYTSFILSLAVFIFRHTTIRTFFLTLLSGVLLLILTTIFSSLFVTNAIALQIVLILYYLVFLLFALWGVKRKTRSAVSGIALNLFVATTAFIPLLITSLYYSFLREKHDYYGDNEIERQLYLKKIALEELHYLYAEIIGFIIFFFLVEFLFKYLYRKWYSQPEQ
jgi:hypothetical protein